MALSGRFFTTHRITVIRGQGRNSSPRTQEGITALTPNSGVGVLVTTTDAHLARRIGDALYRAYKGELEYRYNKADSLLRVSWSR